MLKRYNIRELLSNPARRRMMLANSTVVTMAREGIDITLEDALKSYDAMESSGEFERIRRDVQNWS